MRIATAYQDMSGLGFEQADGVLDEGGFSGSVWSQDSNDVAAADVQVYSMQNLGSAFVIEGDIIKLDQRFSHGSHASRGWENLQLSRSRILRSPFDNDRCGEFDFVVIDHFLQPFQWTNILDIPV